MPQSLLKVISINFKGYKIDIFSGEIAVWMVIGNTEGFAHLFSINYQLKPNLKWEKKKTNWKTVRNKITEVLCWQLCCSVLRTWKGFFFSSHQLFSVVFPFPLHAGLDWQISACTAAFKLMLFGSFCSQHQAQLALLSSAGHGMGREVEENTRNRKLHSVLLSFHNNTILFLF